MVRTSSSKPMSIIRSASSRQRYRQTSRFNIFLSSMSIRRPGVAVITCTPLQITQYIYSHNQLALLLSHAYLSGHTVVSYLPRWQKVHLSKGSDTLKTAINASKTNNATIPCLMGQLGSEPSLVGWTVSGVQVSANFHYEPLDK